MLKEIIHVAAVSIMKTTERCMFLNSGQLDKILSNLILATPQMQIDNIISSKLRCLLRRRGQWFQDDQEVQEVQGVRSLREYRLCREALEDPSRQTEEITSAKITL